MWTIVFSAVAGACFLISLGFVAGAVFSSFSKQELLVASDYLATVVREFLEKVDDRSDFSEIDLAPLRAAVRLFEQVEAPPRPKATERTYLTV